MTADEARHDIPDMPRQSATPYTLTLNDVARLFAEAGLPRPIRSLQRYCVAGRLDCIKEETISGLTYFVEPSSVERAITQLAQLHGLTDEARHSATERDIAHHDALEQELRNMADAARPSAAERDAVPQEIEARLSAPQPDMSEFVGLIKEENRFLREQIGVKDAQIAALLERDKETNFLIRGLQTMLSPLLGTGDRREEPEHRDISR